MVIQAGYVTNEVEGSFWRPYDYMAKVSNTHVIARDTHNGALGMTDVAATVSVSEAAKEMYNKRREEAAIFESEDGVVRRYSYNIAHDELERIDIAL